MTPSATATRATAAEARKMVAENALMAEKIRAAKAEKKKRPHTKNRDSCGASPPPSRASARSAEGMVRKRPASRTLPFLAFFERKRGAPLPPFPRGRGRGMEEREGEARGGALCTGPVGCVCVGGPPPSLIHSFNVTSSRPSTARNTIGFAFKD